MSEIWEAICNVPGVCWWLIVYSLSHSASLKEMHKDMKSLREEIEELKWRVK